MASAESELPAERFTPATIRRHMLGQFPGCPPEDVVEIIGWMQRLDARRMHIELTLPGIVASHVRHRHTDYDRLIDKFGLTPAEALIAVGDEIAETLFRWSKAGVEARQL